MPNISDRIYNIKINGLTESIDATAALNAQLEALSKKIDELSRKASVNIGGTASGGGGGRTSSTNMTLEENKALEEQKQIRKQLSNEAKDLLATDRLSADQYSETMAGLKQRLADIKRVMQHTDIGSEMFGTLVAQAGEITQKLKDIEFSYGTYGRNVGNYANSIREALSGITVNIGGTERTFGTVREASRQLNEELKAMVINGSGNTEEFQQMSDAVHDFNMRVAEADSAVNDLKQTSSTMDDLLDTFQSISAIASISKGFSAFFGFDDAKLEKSLQQLLGLQNVLQGIEAIRKQMITKEGFGKYFTSASNAVDTFSKRLLGTKTALQGVATAEYTATAASKALSLALKSIGIGVLIAAIPYLLDGLQAVVGKFKEWLGLSNDIEKVLQRLETNISIFNTRKIKEEDNALNDYIQGIIDKEEYLKRVTDLQNQSLQQQAKIITQLSTANKEFMLGYNQNWLADQEKRFQANYDAMQKYAAGTEAYAGAYRLLNQSVNAAAGAFIRMVEEGKKTDAELANIIRSTQSLSYLFENLDDVIDDENLRRKLQGIYTSVVNFNPNKALYEQEEAAIAGMKDSVEKYQKEYELTVKKLNEDLTLLDGQRAAAENKARTERDKKIEDFNKKEREKNAEHYKKMSEQAKKREEDLQTLRLTVMRNGLQRTINQIEYERQQRLEKNRQLYSDLRQQEEANNLTNQIFDKKKEQALEDYNKKRVEDERRTEEEILKISQNYLRIRNEVNRRALDDTFNAASYDTTSNNPQFWEIEENHKLLDNLFKERMAKLKEMLADELALEKETIIEEQKAWAEANKERYKEELEEIDAAGLSKEEAERKKFEVTTRYLNMTLAKQREFSAKISAITQTFNEQEQAEYKNHFEDELEIIRNFQTKVNQLVSSQPTMNKGGVLSGLFDVVSFKETKKRLETYIQSMDDELKALTKKKSWVETAFGEGKISAEDRNQLLGSIKSLTDDINQTMSEAKDKSKQLLNDTIQSYMQVITTYTNMIGNAVSDILQSQWDYEDALYDKRIERFEKYIDEYAQLLDKQQEITDEHAEKAKNAEDELAASRGSRRDELIDTLNEQIKAQRQSLAEEKRLEIEKEKLEKQKEAAEKAQAKKNHDRQLAQAIVSGALAVVNGFATTPFIPAGIAAGALAAAVTAVQIANIKRQQYLADGGVIEGRSHAHGGVKTLGGRVEVEGGEFITNKTTTSKNADLLAYINSQRKRITPSDMDAFFRGARGNIKKAGTKYANGGKLPSINTSDVMRNVMTEYSNRPIVVSVVDIVDAQDNLRKVQTLAGA